MQVRFPYFYEADTAVINSLLNSMFNNLFSIQTMKAAYFYLSKTSITLFCVKKKLFQCVSASLEAACKLVTGVGSKVDHCLVIMELQELNGRSKILCPVYSLFKE